MTEISHQEVKKIIIYTDGACSGNPGAGGWACSIEIDGEERKILSGASPETTNNKMELKACIEALVAISEFDKADVTVFTDSTYVRDGMMFHMDGWCRKRWKGSNGKEIKNLPMWKAMYALSRKHSINWEHVDAHSGIAGNEEVDSIARAEIKKYKGRSY